MIRYVNRKTNLVEEEKVYGGKVLSLFYGEGIVSKILYLVFLPLLARFSLFSHLYGLLQRTKRSKKKVAWFIETYKVDTTEFASLEFHSFNDFFIRKLKASCRPVVADPKVLCMPADGRYLVYPTFDLFSVKGQTFSLFSFLQDETLAQRFMNGSMVIARLCPVDYHRFHFPCDGAAKASKLINGSLYSVNPLALKKRLGILAENKRMVTEIDTESFGKILYVEIGATAVGTIQQTFSPGKVAKGKEKGYFAFGGSCIVLLFEKDKIVFDPDLIQNSAQGLETFCKYGTSLGVREDSTPFDL